MSFSSYSDSRIFSIISHKDVDYPHPHFFIPIFHGSVCFCRSTGTAHLSTHADFFLFALPSFSVSPFLLPLHCPSYPSSLVITFLHKMLLPPIPASSDASQFVNLLPSFRPLYCLDLYLVRLVLGFYGRSMFRCYYEKLLSF